MKGSSEKLSRKQERALTALLAHPTISEAAQSCGVSEPTLWRWLKDPAFSAAYNRLRNRLIEATLDQLAKSCGESVTTLRETLTDEAAPPAVKVNAAAKIIQLTLKIREQTEIEDRLRSIEEKIGAQK
jgi:DNA-binding MurR/RpiR family transcriptional regulator